MQFHPLIDDSETLRLELVEVAAGKLPLPDEVWTSREPSSKRPLPDSYRA